MPPPSSATKKTFETQRRDLQLKAKDIRASGPLKAYGFIQSQRAYSGLCTLRPVQKSASALLLGDHLDWNCKAPGI